MGITLGCAKLALGALVFASALADTFAADETAPEPRRGGSWNTYAAENVIGLRAASLVESAGWIYKENIPWRTSMPAVAAVSGKIYVIGGSFDVGGDVQIYDPASDAWSMGRSHSTGSYFYSCAVLDGEIYTIGDCLAGCGIVVEKYNPSSDRWVTLPPMSVPRLDVGALCMSGKFFALGGHNVMSLLNAVECFDPVTNLWTRAADLPFSAILRSCVVECNGKAYILGGFGGSQNNAMDSVYATSDPVNGPWSLVDTMPYKSSRHAVCAYQGRIYMAGGQGPSLEPPMRADVWAYDPATKTWTAMPPLNAPARNGDLVEVSGKLYFVDSFAGTVQELIAPPEPVHRNLAVRSTPTGTPISGDKPGTTDYTALCAEDSTVTLIAPASAKGGMFVRWVKDGVDQPEGAASVSVLMDGDHEVQAVYLCRRLDVASLPAGLAVASEQAPGVTPYAVECIPDEQQVVLTAPAGATVAGLSLSFDYWIVDGRKAPGSEILVLTMSQNHSVVAMYRYCVEGDVNHDGVVNVLDLILVRNQLGQRCQSQ
ncbi:MAG TPA: hypothetical protein VM223_07700 [Planctomycetota bacterium]|nr:hypothetical protein [Planctomycetota bacterium]